MYMTVVYMNILKQIFICMCVCACVYMQIIAIYEWTAANCFMLFSAGCMYTCMFNKCMHVCIYVCMCVCTWLWYIYEHIETDLFYIYIVLQPTVCMRLCMRIGVCLYGCMNQHHTYVHNTYTYAYIQSNQHDHPHKMAAIMN